MRGMVVLRRFERVALLLLALTAVPAEVRARAWQPAQLGQLMTAVGAGAGCSCGRWLFSGGGLAYIAADDAALELPVEGIALAMKGSLGGAVAWFALAWAGVL